MLRSQMLYPLSYRRRSQAYRVGGGCPETRHRVDPLGYGNDLGRLRAPVRAGMGASIGVLAQTSRRGTRSVGVVRTNASTAWPLSERCRRSRTPVGNDGFEAASSVTRISPIAAWDARWAVTLTGSPRAVNSLVPWRHDPHERRAGVDAEASGAHGRRASRDRSRAATPRRPPAPGGHAPARPGTGGTGQRPRRRRTSRRSRRPRTGRARNAIEPIHQAREVQDGHLPRDLARAADVGKQHRQHDLGAAELLASGQPGTRPRQLLEALEAASADLRVLVPRREAVAAQDDGTRHPERRLAQPASGGGGDEPQGTRFMEMRVVPERNAAHSSSGVANAAMTEAA